MTLTTHAIVGAAVAQLFPEHPFLAFSAAFLSHLTIDSLPHWDYDPKSMSKDSADPLATDMKIGPQFFIDLCVIGGDAILGVVLSVVMFSFWLFHAPVPIVLIGAMAGQLPDLLQFVYFKTHSILLEPLQRSHKFVQKGKSLHIPAMRGIGLQAALVSLILIIESFLLRLP